MQKRIFARKLALLCVLFATAAMPAFFVRLDEPTATLNTWKMLAKIGSLCGTVLLLWQMLLGYRQAVALWITQDYLWTVTLHKVLGVCSFAVILLHPIFITPYYLRKENLWLFFGDLPWPLNLLVPLGILSLLIMLMLGVTSTLLREKMGRRFWYITHLSSYVLLPVLFVHGYPIGMTIGETGLRYVWPGLFVLTGLFYLFRILTWWGVSSSVYEVTQVEQQARDVVELCMRPVRRPLKPTSAQFAFFRRSLAHPARPFTISKYEEQTGELSITVKELGRITGNLQGTREGERFLVDGPYGVFGQAALNSDRPIVMLAGGIGVTPFRRLIDELKRGSEREAFLFYGIPYEEDIAHREEIKEAEEAGAVELVHVLSGVEEHEEFEVGNITIDLLQKYLDRDLSAYEFLICGPRPMVEMIEDGLRSEEVPTDQIHHELFTY